MIPFSGPLNADGIIKIIILLYVNVNGRQISEIISAVPAVLLPENTG